MLDGWPSGISFEGIINDAANDATLVCIYT